MICEATVASPCCSSGIDTHPSHTRTRRMHVLSVARGSIARRMSPRHHVRDLATRSIDPTRDTAPTRDLTWSDVNSDVHLQITRNRKNNVQ